MCLIKCTSPNSNSLCCSFQIWNFLRTNELRTEVDLLRDKVESMRKRMGLELFDDLDDFENVVSREEHHRIKSIYCITLEERRGQYSRPLLNSCPGPWPEYYTT